MNLKQFVSKVNKTTKCYGKDEHYWLSAGEPRASGGDKICVTFECRRCQKRVYEFLSLEEFRLCEKHLCK
jgi:hypothetical protein